MKVLLQRVKKASVSVDGKEIAKISAGLLAFVGVEKGDDSACAEKLCEKLLNYRVFSDQDDKMNLSILDTHGELLLVSQFTLAANTQKGRRPSFDSAAPPEMGRALFDELVELCREKAPVQTGEFGASMQVALINDGPVTFLLEA
ncbi:MAG: D-tyrosyl-tRNA(Tyr) deacylase [Bdellovibrionales bacterium]|nr:D-tyrosyl-tRNA(Tyr) deacylase [Bdellovibrionales bacterium]